MEGRSGKKTRFLPASSLLLTLLLPFLAQRPAVFKLHECGLRQRHNPVVRPTEAPRANGAVGSEFRSPGRAGATVFEAAGPASAAQAGGNVGGSPSASSSGPARWRSGNESEPGPSSRPQEPLPDRITVVPASRIGRQPDSGLRLHCRR